MLLRRLATSVLRRGANDGSALAAVRAEIAHELSSSHASSSPPSLQSQDISDFSAVSDASRGQEVLLRRRDASEEVLVSALLAPLRFEGDEPLPRDALMKIFVSKPGLKPVLRFDCRAFADEGDGGAADYDVTAVCYHSIAGDAGEDKYEGPEFRDLDPRLQVALKGHLVTRGVNSKLASSLVHHLIKKEHWQYVNWLKTLEEMFSKDQ
ncbi:mitochondrial acidic protein mam33 [Oryza brachyantha]|uniref:Mitochondrial glycoprotein n=1 Tax=Oryza brachyantha TaxID=4533 RepID=J3NB92_ORYBR|nr:mitochondrial acidic protein mam33 [Oryza brachyantha]